MFGGNMGNMEQMMKQMGIDAEEMEADRVTVEVGDKKLVFSNPNLLKVSGQGEEMFQLRGEYKEEDAGPAEEDIELVMQKTGCSEEEASEALENADDVAEAVMDLQ